MLYYGPGKPIQPAAADLVGDVFAWVCVTRWNGNFDVDKLRHISLVLRYGHPTLICVNSAQLFAQQGAIGNAQVGSCVIRVNLQHGLGSTVSQRVCHMQVQYASLMCHPDNSTHADHRWLKRCNVTVHVGKECWAAAHTPDWQYATCMPACTNVASS